MYQVVMISDKYTVLFIFMLFALNNGFAWLMFDPVADWLERGVVGMSARQLQILSSWQPLMFLLMFLPVMKMVAQPDGLRKAVRLGASCEMAGAIFKTVGAMARGSPAGVVFLHIGQIFSGIGSPVATGCVSALSALWFDPEERTRATAFSVLSNSMGNAFCYILVPAMIEAHGLLSVTLHESLMAAICVVLVWTVFPAQAESHPDWDDTRAMPTATPQTGETPLHVQLRQLFGNTSAVYLLLIYAWSSGGFSAWISLFDETYHNFFSARFIGFMSFSAVMAYVAGGLLSSYLTDLYFRRQMKHVIFLCVTCNSMCNLMFVALAPNDEGHTLWTLGKEWIVATTALCGFCNGAAAPLCYELLAEISFPVDESVSGITLSVGENIGALFFYQVVSRLFTGDSMSIAYSFGMMLVVALAGAVRQRYNRSRYAHMQGGVEVFEQIAELECHSTSP